ncbi:hypothetical protein F5880DRAFT_1611264 [Lentinula raphanica]|nr:hypothetical protein F5880DRAFT_1611264 [Lentinula raphanica]
MEAQGVLDLENSSPNHSTEHRSQAEKSRNLEQFFDLEAQVDSDEEDFESEDDEEDGFIDDQEISPGRSMTSPINTDPPVSASAFLDFLEQKYTHREDPNSLSIRDTSAHLCSRGTPPIPLLSRIDKIRLNNAEDWAGERARRSIYPSDWQLYRLKCTVRDLPLMHLTFRTLTSLQPDKEVDIVHRLQTQHDFRTELRSVYHNRDIIGVIFLEARFSRERIRNTPSLLEALAVYSDVRISTLRVVPQDEYHASLSGYPSPTAFYATGDWVSIEHGLYKGDTGLVLGYTEASGGRLSVLLAPRLALRAYSDEHEFEQRRVALKRKRGQIRPCPVLFTFDRCGSRAQDLVTRVHADDAVTEQDYKHKTLGSFSHGLVIKHFVPKSVTPATSITSEVLSVFQESHHPLFMSAPALRPDLWVFLPGEKVTATRISDSMTSRAAVTNHSNDMISGTVEVVTETGCEVDTEEGLVHIPFYSLRKVIVPGEYVKVLTGSDKDTTGLVAAVTPRFVGVIPDYSQITTSWYDCNTVGLTDSSCLVQTNFPWKNVQVRIMGGLFSNHTAIIKNVFPDGHGSLRLLLFVPSIHHSLQLDYTLVVENSSGLLLTRYQPIPQSLQNFVPNHDLEAMKTGPTPWIRARVVVVKGPWKGYSGVVYDVNVYKLSSEQLARGASGITLIVELSVVTPTETHPRRSIDYDYVRESFSKKPLADAIKPTERQSFFMPMSNYNPSRHNSTQKVPATQTGTRCGTPEPTDFARSLIFTGVWHPQSDAGNTNNWVSAGETVFRPPPDYFNTDDPPQSSHHPEMASLETCQELWIYHRNLVGIPIGVSLKGRKGIQFVKVLPQGSGFKIIQDRSTGGEPLLVWTPDVSRFNDRPKPKTEKSLMVLVQGPEEQIGRLVRRIHHFYKGRKTDNNLWFILGVVEFLSETEEILTSERIDAHPDQLERVQETQAVRRASNLVMSAARDEYRFQSPEVRP